MARPKSTEPKQVLNTNELEQDWYPNKPNMEVDARIRRIATGTDTRQKKILEKIPMPEQIPQPNVTTVYAYKNKLWQVSGFRCLDCGKLMNSLQIVEKHPLICNHGLKINKQEEDEILKLVKGYKNADKKD